MQNKSRVYDRVAPHYDRWMRHCERVGLARLRAAALALMPEGGRLLEVGAGTGGNFPFYPKGARAACAEPSREMLLRAQVKPERPPGAALFQSVAEQLPFDDDTFDAAFATLVFCSVASPERAFAELRRVVRSGGRVALVEHVRPPNPLGYAFDALSLLTVALMEDHFNRRTADLARRAGLEVERVDKHLLGI